MRHASKHVASEQHCSQYIPESNVQYTAASPFAALQTLAAGVQERLGEKLLLHLQSYIELKLKILLALEMLMHMLKQKCCTSLTYARPWHNARKVHVIVLDDVCFQHQHIMHSLQVEAFFYLRVWHKDHVQCHYRQQRQAAYCISKDSFGANVRKTERLQALQQILRWKRAAIRPRTPSELESTVTYWYYASDVLTWKRGCMQHAVLKLTKILSSDAVRRSTTFVQEANDSR